MTMMGSDHEPKGVERRAWPPVLAKVALAAVSVLLLVSMGGQMLLPILLPAYLWAARTSGPIGRALWVSPFGIGFGVIAWAGVYTVVGEAKPAIWLLPLGVTVAATIPLWRVARPSQPDVSERVWTA
jgi:hypothetical protein